MRFTMAYRLVYGSRSQLQPLHSTHNKQHGRRRANGRDWRSPQTKETVEEDKKYGVGDVDMMKLNNQATPTGTYALLVEKPRPNSYGD